MTESKITLEDLKGLLSKSYDLVYVDYRSEIHDKDALNNAVRSNSYEPIYDDSDEWINDCQADSVGHIMKDLVSEVSSAFDIDEHYAEEIIDDYEDELRDEIYQRDTSTPIKDLLSNTGDQVFFYDTGLDFQGFGNGAAQYRLDRIAIKKLFGINNSDHDKAIDEVLNNASYGGQLVVYFRSSIDDLIIKNEPNVITFRDAHFAIIDTMNGSGHDSTLPKHQFSLPFSRSNLFMDKAVSYSYTYDVCGMASNWCDGTSVSFDTIEGTKLPEPSSIAAHMEQQKKYDETFKAGKCTFGDVKYDRHRNRVYKNEYPCGTHCKDCGQFWVD